MHRKSFTTVSINNIYISVLTGQIHWICITNINCARGSVKVHDSLYTTLTPLTKLQIADLLQIQQGKKIDVLIQTVVAQTNSLLIRQQVYALVMTHAFSSSTQEISSNISGIVF